MKQLTLDSVNPLSILSQKWKIGFLKTVLPKFVNLTSNESDTFKLWINCLVIIIIIFLTSITFRDGSSSHVTPGKWVFVAIVNDWYLWTIYTGNFIPSVPGILDLQLRLLLLYNFYMCICIYVSLCIDLNAGGRLGVHKKFWRFAF